MKSIRKLTLQQIFEILTHIKIIHYPIGSVIFQQGEKSMSAFIIMKGEITFYEEKIL